jgi:ABC-type microcin C transport system permease subunit YejE
MTLDNKISFISGFVFTALSTVTIMGVAQAALVGLVGGFFGLLGKELYYFIKKKIKSKV